MSDSDPSDRFRFNSDGGGVGEDYEKNLRELAKVVMQKYNYEFKRFLNQLIEERGDGELRSLLRKLDTDGTSPDPWKPSHPREPDEIVAPKADRGAEASNS
jgi:hypothetical protein